LRDERVGARLTRDRQAGRQGGERWCRGAVQKKEQNTKNAEKTAKQRQASASLASKIPTRDTKKETKTWKWNVTLTLAAGYSLCLIHEGLLDQVLDKVASRLNGEHHALLKLAIQSAILQAWPRRPLPTLDMPPDVVRVDPHEVAQTMRHENSRQVQCDNLRTNSSPKSDATARCPSGVKGRLKTPRRAPRKDEVLPAPQCLAGIPGLLGAPPWFARPARACRNTQLRGGAPRKPAC
jgi:hypothetical protein